MSKSILIVDHTKVGQKMLSGHLKQLGHDNVSISASAKDAKEQVAKNKFDLIVCAYDLEMGDGTILFKDLQGSGLLSGTPFLLITADQDESVFIHSATSGVTNIIFKPYQLDQLKQKVELALQG